MPHTRASDTGDVRPTRTVPVMSLIAIALPIVLPIVGALLLMWREQGLNNQQQRYQNERMLELVVEMKSTRLALEQKNLIDAQQTTDQKDHERRISRLETLVK